MFYRKEDITTSKLQTKLDFIQGTVNFYNESVILRHDSYTKRKKLFDLSYNIITFYRIYIYIYIFLRVPSIVYYRESSSDLFRRTL